MDTQVDNADIFERIGTFLTNNPLYLSLAFLTFSLLLIIASIMDVDWLFKPRSTDYNNKKLGGMVNLYGRNTMRFYVGISGVVLLFISSGLVYYYL